MAGEALGEELAAALDPSGVLVERVRPFWLRGAGVPCGSIGRALECCVQASFAVMLGTEFEREALLSRTGLSRVVVVGVDVGVGGLLRHFELSWAWGHAADADGAGSFRARGSGGSWREQAGAVCVDGLGRS